MLDPAIYSAVARDLLPGEVLWFDFYYETDADTDAELASSDVGAIAAMLGEMAVNGDQVIIHHVEPLVDVDPGPSG